MKRILIVVIVLFVLLTGGLLAAPGFVDWNRYKPEILAQIRTATGYEVAIDGPLSMAVLPFPHLEAAGISVTNPVVGKEPLAKLEKAGVQLALAPLFSGKIEVSKVQLVKPVIALEIAPDGTPSWMTPELEAKKDKGAASEDKGGTGLAESVMVNAIDIRDGALSYIDRRTGRSYALTGATLSLKGDSLYGPYSLEGEALYGKTEARLHLDTGRLDAKAESVPMQLDLYFPDLGARLTYSGVLSLKNGPDIQGETGLESRDLAALSALTGKPLPEALKGKSLNAKGLLTFAGNTAAYRNMTLTYAGAGVGGSVTVQNFQEGAQGPLEIAATLDALKAIDLDALLPASGAKGKAVDGGAFLPETLTLPKDVVGALTLKAPAMTFRDVSYSDAVLSVETEDKGYALRLSVKGPGNALVDANGRLSFIARSRSEKDGSVTLSDPLLVLETKLETEEPLKAIQSFLKAPLPDPVKNVLASRLASETRLKVKPHEAVLDAGFITLGDTRVNASGAFVPAKTAEGRPALRAALALSGLDMDQWARKIAGPGNPVADEAAKKLDIAALAKSVQLPFDLDISLDLQGVHAGGRDFSKLAARGALTDETFRLDGLDVLSAAGESLKVAGGIKDVPALAGIDLSVTAGVPDPAGLIQSFGMDASHLPATIGKAEIVAALKGGANSLGFTVNLKALRGTLQAEGSVGGLLATPKLSDLTLRFRHPNYVDLARLFNPAFNSGVSIRKDLDVFGTMSRKGDVYTFSGLQATVGPSAIKGDVIADMGGARPAITAALDATDLPVDKLFGIQAGGTRGGAKGSGGKAAAPETRWSRDAIDTSVLHKADVAVKATAASLSYGNWTFKNAGINLDLKDGTLDIKQFDGGFSGGHVAVTGALKSSPRPREPLSFSSHLLAQNISLEEFVRAFSGSRLVKASGAVSLDTDILTTGLSPAALVFDLSGKGTASGKDIVFAGFDLAGLSRALNQPSSSFRENFGRLFDTAMKGGSTRFDTLDGAYTIREGVILFDKMDLLGPAADVATRGTVSLPLWTMDLESTIQLKEPEDAPPLHAAFKGPIDRPGQTFGQNALKQYFQNQMQGVVLNPLLESLQKKGVIGGGHATQKAPSVASPAASEAASEPAAGPETQQPYAPSPAEQAQPVPEKKQITPEDALFGILQNVIQGQ